MRSALAIYGVVLAELLARPAWATAGFTLTSPGLAAGATLPQAQTHAGHGCTGTDTSPALVWTAPPAGTKSLAVTLFDPDARGGKGFWHWAMIDVPPDTRQLSAGAAPPEGARAALNDFGTAGYGGACPPPGDPPHHYVFTIWALGDAKPSADAGVSDADVGAFLAAHAIAKATLTLRYGRT